MSNDDHKENVLAHLGSILILNAMHKADKRNVASHRYSPATGAALCVSQRHQIGFCPTWIFHSHRVYESICGLYTATQIADILYAVRNDAINGNRSHVPSPPRSGEKVAAGRMRGRTHSGPREVF